MKYVSVSEAARTHRPTPVDPQSDVVRELLVKADLTLIGAARLLDIRVHVLRGYCTGERVPRMLILALERLVEMQRDVDQARLQAPK